MNAITAPRLIFYTTEGCHLCEYAAAMLDQIQDKIDLKVVDISEDESLVQRYGIRIPVVRNEQSQAEVGWPFSSEELEQLLAQ